MVEEGKVRFIGFVEAVEDGYAEIRVLDKFCSGLDDIEEFSHIIILYWLHLRDVDEHRRVLKVTPKRHGLKREIGVFSTRSPSRPNPIGLSVVEILSRRGCTLRVKGLDAYEGTPIIDIKPYIPRADAIHEARTPDWVLRGPKT